MSIIFTLKRGFITKKVARVYNQPCFMDFIRAYERDYDNYTLRGWQVIEVKGV